MNPIKTTLALSLALLAAEVFPAPEAAHSQGNALSVTLQNDAVAGTDHRYSSGFEFTSISWKRHASLAPFDAPPEWFAYPPAPGALTRVAGDSFQFRTLAVGQKIYTPSDLSRSDYIARDRPYAGWTYVKIANEKSSAAQRSLIAIEAGTFGPNSQAGDFQRSIHKFIGSATPRGWEHQVQNKIAADLVLERENRLFSRRIPGDYRLNLSAAEQLTIGTARAHLKLDWIARLGKGNTGSRRPSIQYFSRASLSLVGRDRSLSGPLPGEFTRVAKSSLVPAFELGFEYRVGKRSLAFSLIQQGRQFKSQAGNHTFGSLRYTVW
ncbi:hypothetical protein VDG1235_2142 [Verrucomicrobiia bacterium DG1235]|nr:hypothetical protein VDG1235_2142 [Verrucomicrobiae bacterium DG1235]